MRNLKLSNLMRSENRNGVARPGGWRGRTMGLGYKVSVPQDEFFQSSVGRVVRANGAVLNAYSYAERAHPVSSNPAAKRKAQSTFADVPKRCSSSPPPARVLHPALSPVWFTVPPKLFSPCKERVQARRS